VILFILPQFHLYQLSPTYSTRGKDCERPNFRTGDLSILTIWLNIWKIIKLF